YGVETRAPRRNPESAAAGRAARSQPAQALVYQLLPGPPHSIGGGSARRRHPQSLATMDAQPPNYHREFMKSPQHAALGFLTRGVGCGSGAILPLIVGVTCYILGWIYLPDLAFFKRWVDKRCENARRCEEQLKVADFVKRREALIGSLSPSRRERYRRL